MPVGAAIGGSVASGIGSVANGVLGANAAGTASKAAQQAAAEDKAYSEGIYNTAQTNVNPYINSGSNATSALSGLLGTGGDPAASQTAFNNYLNSTNYKFQLGQGEQGVEYANAPAFNSSATAKALNNYAQGQAGSALQGYEGLLQGQSQLGSSSALGLGQIGTNIAQQVSNANNFAANGIGVGAQQTANAYGNALNGVIGAGNQYLTQSSFGAGSALGGLGTTGSSIAQGGLDPGNLMSGWVK